MAIIASGPRRNACLLYTSHQLGLVDTLRQALTFCGSTYTTVGYNSDLMPEGWKVMTMIIALSGMFSFAWTTGVMMLMLKPFHAAQYARITGRDPQNCLLYTSRCV